MYHTSASFKDFLNNASNNSNNASPSPKTKSNKKITFVQEDEVFEIENNNKAFSTITSDNEDEQQEVEDSTPMRGVLDSEVVDSTTNRGETRMSHDELDDIDLVESSPTRPKLQDKNEDNDNDIEIINHQNGDSE